MLSKTGGIAAKARCWYPSSPLLPSIESGTVTVFLRKFRRIVPDDSGIPLVLVLGLLGFIVGKRLDHKEPRPPTAHFGSRSQSTGTLIHLILLCQTFFSFLLLPRHHSESSFPSIFFSSGLFYQWRERDFPLLRCQTSNCTI
jgi:hypothetical protein